MLGMKVNKTEMVDTKQSLSFVRFKASLGRKTFKQIKSDGNGYLC